MKKKDQIGQGTFYEVTDFSSASIFKFKFVNDDELKRATDLLNAMERSSVIEDVSKNMLLTNCKRFSTIDEVLGLVKSVWETDFFDNIERSKKEGWDFYYFFPEVKYIDNAFLIVANLYYPPNESETNVLYNLVVVKTDGEFFYAWDMTN